MLGTFFMILITILSLFLIALILIQKGRGGGLAGAFGGMGGQSAFGTKAGDLFTKITVGASLVWIVLCAAAVKLYTSPDDRFDPTLGSGLPNAPFEREGATPDASTGAGESATPLTPPPPTTPGAGSPAAAAGGAESTPTETPPQ